LVFHGSLIISQIRSGCLFFLRQPLLFCGGDFFYSPSNMYNDITKIYCNPVDIFL